MLFYDVKLILLIIFLNFSFIFIGFAQNQTENIRNSAISVFIDCQSCDIDYIKRKISFVNYVRDTKEADVHILFTTQAAGNGGNEYGFIFLGQKDFFNRNDTLRFVSRADNTQDEIRDKEVKYLKMGLIFYASHSKLANNLEINYENSDESENKIVKDKWNNWVFSLTSQAWMNGESSYSNVNSFSNIRAECITPDWKYIFRLGNNFSQSKFVIDEGNTYIGINRSYIGKALVVKSLSEHWSAGFKSDIGSSTFKNNDFYINLLPAVEYNIFPYSQSSVKQLTIRLESGFKYVDYTDTTIYNKMTDNLMLSKIAAAYQIKQKWGNINMYVEGTTYWYDILKYNSEMYISLDIRILKGFSVRLSGGGSLIRNQLNLKKENASYEDILLRQQEVATNYNFWLSGGLTYTFGSIYNNVVNPRFDN